METRPKPTGFRADTGRRNASEVAGGRGVVIVSVKSSRRLKVSEAS
jgi:hypothetical protein